MVEYSTVNAKLSDIPLKKLKSAVKTKTGTTLTVDLKVFNGLTAWIVTDNKTKNKTKKCI